MDASDATSTDEFEEQGILDKNDFKAPPPPLAVLAAPPLPATAPDDEDGG